MLKLSLLIVVCTILTTGYLQEIGNNLFSPSIDNNDNRPAWPFQGYQIQRKRVKPCPRRSNNEADSQWIPSYSSRITRPLHEPPVLQPQALKNAEFIENLEEIKTDSGNEQINPELQSLDTPYYYMKTSDLSEEDCIDQLESANDTTSNSPDATKAALKIIEDCIKAKQKSEAKPQPTLLGSSRRSMSDPDGSENINNDINSKSTKNDQNTDSDKNNNYPRAQSEADTVSETDPQNNVEDKNANKLTTKLMDPQKGTGIAERRGNGYYPSNSRVCYACSTATNPSCWEPNKSTTVKYCTREQSCVTKTFGVRNALTLIRDCANTCEDSMVPGIEPKYKSCKLCHKDFCNGAFSINSYNLVIILIISIVKCTF